MKKVTHVLVVFLLIFSAFSCSNREELKEISGSFEFKDAGKHPFVINADHIEATIKLIGANGGETLILNNVKLDRNARYTAVVGGVNRITGQTFEKTELINNFVVEYEALSGKNPALKNGMIRIDWVGFDY